MQHLVRHRKTGLGPVVVVIAAVSHAGAHGLVPRRGI